MAYGNEILKYGKEHIYIVEIDLDYCSLTYGTGACTVDPVLTGNGKCFNTADSHQSVDGNNNNYDGATNFKTYRFCQDRSPHPIGIDAIPSLGAVGISPAKIDLEGGLGVRASVDLTFNDHPSSDIGIDKYVDDRSYIAFERGTYWTKLRARNPNYENRPLRVLSGYLVDGVFDAVNFTTRYYIIDKMTVTNGKAMITAKDPLKLASSKKAQAPAVSTGQLDADILAADTTAVLSPAGVGNLEYPASGKILINSEVISFNRSGDDLTGLVRGENNTIAADHGATDTVQLCLEYIGKQVDFIVYDLLVNYANINLDFIPVTSWAAEINTYLPGSLSGIIVKPYDVFKSLKELAEAMPHYLWWDENTQSDGRKGAIQLTALKAPPDEANLLNMDGNIIADSFKTTDKPNLRISTVFVNFGQFDPTKKLDEPSNYRQTYVRVDNDSISKYGSNEIKTINSRWITNNDKATAIDLAALIGRRFSGVPREVAFSLEAKDSNVWVGQNATINHRDITDYTGAPVDTVFQILSSKESKNFNYSALEFTYGGEIDGDPSPGEELIYIGVDEQNVNLFDLYTIKNPSKPAVAGDEITFVVDTGVKTGSTSTATYSLDTGSWDTGVVITLKIEPNGFVVGKGGDGQGQAITPGASVGGDAIILNHDLILINNGTIGGGGGGAFRRFYSSPQSGSGYLAGGGGAGFDVGLAYNGASNGTLLLGGSGSPGPRGLGGYTGGGLGLAPPTSGQTAGIAINRNGFNLAYNPSSDIRGNVIN